MPISTPTQIDAADEFAYSTGGGTSANTTSASVPAGSDIFLLLTDKTAGASSTNISAIMDSAGNIYQLLPGTVDTTFSWLASTWYCLNCNALASGSSFIVTGTGAGTVNIMFAGYSTGANGGADQNVSAQSASSATVGPLTTGTLASASEILFLIISSVENGGGNIGNTGSFTNLTISGSTGWTGYLIVSSNSSVSVTPQFNSGAADYSAQLVSFKATGAASGIAVWPYRM